MKPAQDAMLDLVVQQFVVVRRHAGAADLHGDQRNPKDGHSRLYAFLHLSGLGLRCCATGTPRSCWSCLLMPKNSNVGCKSSNINF